MARPMVKNTCVWITSDASPGAMRPFEERAELDGKGPAVWSPGDAAYLQQVLPRP
jgi:hypothetical protein